MDARRDRPVIISIEKQNANFVRVFGSCTRLSFLCAVLVALPACASGFAETGSVVYADVSDGDPEIYVMNRDWPEGRQLTDNEALDNDPSWSPDGKQIAFTSDIDGDREIYVMNADGSNQVRLTNASGSDEQPTWSPDGKQIAFISQRDGGREIYKMNSDGTNQTRLTNNSHNEYSPSWK